jgi:tetratricopeptide (TPR) repeat protein
MGAAEGPLRQAMSLWERLDRGPVWFGTLGFHGIVLVNMGDCAEGLAEIQRACAWAQETNAPTEIAQSYHFLTSAYVLIGDRPRSVEAARRAVETAQQSGDPFYAYVGYFMQSWAALHAEQYAAGEASVAKAQALAQKLGEPLIHGDWLAAVHAEIAFGAGRVQEAIALAERAVDIAQGVGSIISEGMARRAWGQALAALQPPEWDQAEAHLSESLRLFEEGQARLQAARTRVAWGSVCCDRGDLAGARAHWERAAAQWERSDLAHKLERTRALIHSLA